MSTDRLDPLPQLVVLTAGQRRRSSCPDRNTVELRARRDDYTCNQRLRSITAFAARQERVEGFANSSKHLDMHNHQAMPSGKKDRPQTHRVEPHLVYIHSILFFWELDAPLAAVLVRFIFPRRDDAFL